MPRAVADGLRRREIDVERAQDIGLADATDYEHLRYAFRAKRVIITHDKDFIRLNQQNEQNYGIAYCKQGSRSIGEMIDSLVLIYEAVTPEQMIRHVEFL